MKIHRFATGLLARNVATTTQFYVDHFGFKKTMDIGWFTSMGHNDPAYELSVVASEHNSVPAEFQRPMYGLLAFVVEDAAAQEARLREAGVEIVKPTTDELYGQRHFYCTDPDGTLIDVIEPITPNPEWLKQNGLADESP
jgi:catechol 2,3-dioxygenase-like lactoylglutathione lyase family enzyme